jgi:hypothetical protein
MASQIGRNLARAGKNIKELGKVVMKETKMRVGEAGQALKGKKPVSMKKNPKKTSRPKEKFYKDKRFWLGAAAGGTSSLAASAILHED